MCSTVDFVTVAGEDGLPERIHSRAAADDTSAGNDYTRMRACEPDLCAQATRTVGREDGNGTEEVRVDVQFVKQAAGTQVTTAAVPPEPLPASGPRGLGAGAAPLPPGMPRLPGMPPVPSAPPLSVAPNIGVFPATRLAHPQ